MVFGHWSTHMNIRVLRRDCLTTGLQACPRGSAPEEVKVVNVLALPSLAFHTVVGFWTPESSSSSAEFRSFLLNMCTDPESTTNFLSSGFFEDGAGSDQTSAGEKNVALSLSFFAKSHASLRAHVARFLSVFCPRIWEHKDYAREVQNAG